MLEIGPANGIFASEICNLAKNVSYIGLDWSETMVEQARDTNSQLMKNRSVRFVYGNSKQLMFADNSFNHVLAIHTIYFWNKPLQHLSEIHRVLKQGGRFYLAFGDRCFMEKLSFTQYGFKLYRRTDVFSLLNKVGFTIIQSQQFHETGLSNSGKIQNKTINIIECKV